MVRFPFLLCGDQNIKVSFFFFPSSPYTSKKTTNLPAPPRKRDKRNEMFQLVVQQCGCRLARVRLEAFHLQLEVPNFGVGLAQFGVEPVVITL